MPAQLDAESERLAVLAEYSRLDGIPDAQLDAITRLASDICATPIALVSLVSGEQQVFEGRYGLDVCQTSREVAFCAYALYDDEPLQVPDALEDARFCKNPLVTGPPYIRCYTGIPLKVASGHRLGTLCVIDTVPRRFDAKQMRALHDLAGLVVRLLEERRATRQAETREAMLESLLEAMPEGAIACDIHGRLTVFNSVARGWHNGGSLNVLPEQWARYFELFEADGETALADDRVPLVRLLNGESVRDQEICVKAHPHAPRSVVCNGRLFSNGQGQTLGAVAVLHDVTERKRRDQELADTRRHLQAVIDASTEVAIIALDTTGRVTLFNPGAQRLLGYEAEDVVGRFNVLDFHLPKEVAEHAKAMSEEFGRELSLLDAFTARPRAGQIESRDWTFVRRDGGVQAVRLVVSPIRDGKNKLITGFLGIAIDRSQVQNMSRALQLSEQRFRNAFDTAPHGMALVSLEGNFLEVNRALCEMWGYEREALLALDFQMLTHPDDLAVDLEHLQQLVRGEVDQYQLSKRYYRQDGQMMWGQLAVSIVRSEENQPLYYVAQIEDITEQRQLERMMSQFVAVVSHELRTPLTSVNGALKLVNAGALGELPAQASEVLQIAARNTDRLGLLVNDLLDWEKLSADKMGFDYATYSLRRLLQDAVDSNAAYASTCDVRLTLEGDGDASVEVDALRFGQIMANLLSNAAKFSPANDTVVVRYRMAQTRVVVEVEDHGPGIPQAFRNRVFQLFAQAEGGNTRRHGGTGLGLAIAKQLVEQMGGHIGFDTQDGLGTVFRVELPRVGEDQPCLS